MGGAGAAVEGSEAFRFQVLGPVTVFRGGDRVPVGGVKVRAILAMLLLDANRVVSANRLLEGVWGPDAPDGAKASLQVHVSNLRKVLGPGVVETVAPGYVLHATDDQVDLRRFERAVAAAREGAGRVDPAATAAALAEALAEWSGPPLDDLADVPFAPASVSWLVERRVAAAELHVDALLDSGEHGEAVSVLEGLLAEHPHRERFWGQLMLALYRGGRQADALAAYQRARSRLAEDLGVEPGPELRDVERRVLAQAADLDAPSTAADGPSSPVHGSADDMGPTYRVAARSRCHLVVDGTTVPLDGLCTVGRSPDNDVPLTDSAVSRRHAELRPALGSYLLVDLGSTNGTTVNGELVTNHILSTGDRIEIGPHVLAYVAEEVRSDPV